MIEFENKIVIPLCLNIRCLPFPLFIFLNFSKDRFFRTSIFWTGKSFCESNMLSWENEKKQNQYLTVGAKWSKNNSVKIELLTSRKGKQKSLFSFCLSPFLKKFITFTSFFIWLAKTKLLISLYLRKIRKTYFKVWNFKVKIKEFSSGACNFQNFQKFCKRHPSQFFEGLFLFNFGLLWF